MGVGLLCSALPQKQKSLAVRFSGRVIFLLPDAPLVELGAEPFDPIPAKLGDGMIRAQNTDTSQEEDPALDDGDWTGNNRQEN